MSGCARLGYEWDKGDLSVIIIDEEFARRYWPDQDPIGEKVRLPWGDNREEQPLLTVVGVVGRVKENSLTERGGMVQAYFPYLQFPIPDMAAVLKTAQEPKSLVGALREAVSSMDPEQPIFGVGTLAEFHSRNIASERLTVTLLGLFSSVALILALVGLHGVLAYSVAQRRREFGIRMALGARTTSILRLVLGQGLRLTAYGIALGLIGAFAVSRILKSLLFEVKAHDPFTFAAVMLLLLVVAALACLIPARRAATVHPMEALRCE